MRTLIVILSIFFWLGLAQAGEEKEAPAVQRPVVLWCGEANDLRKVLDEVVEDAKFFATNFYSVSDHNYYNKKWCGVYEIPEGARAYLHGFYRSKAKEYVGDYKGPGEPGFIFSVYRLSLVTASGRAQERYLANGVYSPEFWRIGRGEDCGAGVTTGNCLIPRTCDAPTRHPPTAFLHFQAKEYEEPENCREDKVIVF